MGILAPVLCKKYDSVLRRHNAAGHGCRNGCKHSAGRANARRRLKFRCIRQYADRSFFNY
jgi:hypothetical protein